MKALFLTTVLLLSGIVQARNIYQACSISEEYRNSTRTYESVTRERTSCRSYRQAKKFQKERCTMNYGSDSKFVRTGKYRAYRGHLNLGCDRYFGNRKKHYVISGYCTFVDDISLYEMKKYYCPKLKICKINRSLSGEDPDLVERLEDAMSELNCDKK